MVWFEHAQPALLYIVPFLTVFTCVPAFLNGEWKQFWGYNSNSIFEDSKPLEEGKKEETAGDSSKKAE